MLKKTCFRNLCHVLQRTLVVSVVCFFTMVSYAWAYNVNFVCGNGATAISGAINPVSVSGFFSLQLSDATQYCQTSYSGWQPLAITCRDASQNVKCLIFDAYPGCNVNANLTCTVEFAHKSVSPFVLNTCDGDFILYYSVEQNNGDYTLYANYGVNGPSNPVDAC